MCGSQRVRVCTVALSVGIFFKSLFACFALWERCLCHNYVHFCQTCYALTGWLCVINQWRPRQSCATHVLCACATHVLCAWRTMHELHVVRIAIATDASVAAAVLDGKLMFGHFRFVCKRIDCLASYPRDVVCCYAVHCDRWCMPCQCSRRLQ